MYKVIFFDLVNTLVRYDPPPEHLQGSALRRLGMDVTELDLRRGHWAANEYFTQESARWSMEKRPQEEKEKVWLNFELTFLRSAGIDASPELAIEMLRLLREVERRVVPFEDTVPTLGALRNQGLVVGLISNLDMTMDQFCPDVDLASHLDLLVISHEVGCEKPHPEIFELALQRSGARASEAIMVGDQYYSDIVGAVAAGLKPLWLDRDSMFDDRNGCQRISGLMEILDHL